MRLIFKLFLEGDGESGPMDVKNIASWLNARGYKTPRGGAYYLGRVHALLTNEAYTGSAWFNRKNSRTGETRPRDQWIRIAISPLVTEQDFQRVQIILKDRRPTSTPPRLTNNAVLLSGVAICEGCGKPLMLTTGRGGAYRYYKCSGKHLKVHCAGNLAITIREEKLDQIILNSIADHLLTPTCTQAIVEAVAKRRQSGQSDSTHALSQLRGQLGQVNKRLRNLLDAVAEGLTGDTIMFKESLANAEAEREELLRLITAQEAQVKDALKPVSLEAARLASTHLKRLLKEAPPSVKKRYIRAFVSEIVVGKSEIVVSGPKDALAEAATGTPPAHIAAASGPVRSFVREWRTDAGETGNWLAHRMRSRKVS